MEKNEMFIAYLLDRGVLRSPQIIAAFRAVDRKYFVPKELEAFIYEDRPLPIGEGQTISQPSTVAFMLELLAPMRGEKILDIGSGSGWTTALLCHIVGEEGSVLGLERVDDLLERGRKNLKKFHFGSHCRIEKADEILGRPSEKFDRILVSASAETFPVLLVNQLNIGGVLVIPVQNDILKITRIAKEQVKREVYSGFRFVPLIYQE